MEYRELMGLNGYFIRNRDSIMIYCFNFLYVIGFKLCIRRDDRNFYLFFLFERYRFRFWLGEVIC